MSYASVLRNTEWNLAGSALPILVAIVAIPPLIRGLGDERFGALAIGWVVMAYFVLSDFGIGRATTKYLSELDDEAGSDGASTLAWTSLFTHGLLGIAGGERRLLACRAVSHRPSFRGACSASGRDGRRFLLASGVHPGAAHDSLSTQLSRGAEALRSDNILRVLTSAVTYLVPLLVLQASNNISNMLAAIFGGRRLVLSAHVLCALQVVPELAKRSCFGLCELRRLIGFGVWGAVSGLINPIMLFVDRFLVATLFSMGAVTYYVTTYEGVTKLWIVSASLLGALFPVPSVTDHRSPEMALIIRKTFVLLVVTTTPVVGIILVFASDLLSVWIDTEFSRHSGTVATWLAVGVFVNILAQIPFTVLQATGRPGTVARLQLIQLPLFLLLARWLYRWQGTVGVAMAWALRALVDALLLQWAAARWMGGGAQQQHRIRVRLRLLPIPMFLAISWLLGGIWREQALPRTLGFIVALIVFSVWFWRGLLVPAERSVLVNALRRRLRWESA